MDLSTHFLQIYALHVYKTNDPVLMLIFIQLQVMCLLEGGRIAWPPVFTQEPRVQIMSRSTLALPRVRSERRKEGVVPSILFLPFNSPSPSQYVTRVCFSCYRRKVHGAHMITWYSARASKPNFTPGRISVMFCPQRAGL